MVTVHDLAHIAALLATDRLRPEAAVKLGEELLVEGHDHASVIALASVGPEDNSEALDLMVDVLDHLGVGVPGVEDGAFRLGLDEVNAIANGIRDPIEGAYWIWREIWAKYHFSEFSTFVALLDDLDTATSTQREEINQEIFDRARRMTGE